MTSSFTRRHVIAGIGATSALSTTALPALAQTKANLIIVGGGFGGATAARYLKRLAPGASVTLIEPNAKFISCPFSNLVIAGERTLEQQTFSYENLVKSGITLIRERASKVDAPSRTVTLESGKTLSYDRLVLSPGIDFRWDALEGYDEAASAIMPHAWKAGPQTQILRDQLQEMEDGGLVVMSVPPAPFRCPPGPYERASLIAHYLKTQKPKSKLLILDAKDKFSKMPLFQEAWAKHYPDHLEWRSATDDGTVTRVDAATKILSSDFEDIKADVANVIPPQQAGQIARASGVADDTGWCPVNPLTFESTLQPNIHVIGDASIAAPMPKSAFSANLQAKVCAIQIAVLLAGDTPEATLLNNTCYSFTTPGEAVSISGVYRNADNTFASVPGAGGLSPLAADNAIRAAEAAQANDWFAAIIADTLG